MSKSIEALDNLIMKTGIINDTCANLKDCIKCGKCKFDEPVETCDDYNLIMTIKQDLEHKEQLENRLKDKIAHIEGAIKCANANGNDHQAFILNCTLDILKEVLGNEKIYFNLEKH